YSPKTIEVQADIQNKYKEPSCNSVFISRQQLVKILVNEEILLVYVVKEYNENINPHNPEIRKILQDFAKVFPKALPDQLPPKRAVNHGIDLILGSVPLFLPIYRISYEELDELKY
ncbi:15418_t:CDS:1, partial [Racocetra persica]